MANGTTPSFAGCFHRFEYVGDFFTIVDGNLRCRLDNGTVQRRGRMRAADSTAFTACSTMVPKAFSEVVQMRNAYGRYPMNAGLSAALNSSNMVSRRAWLVADAEWLAGRRG